MRDVSTGNVRSYRSFLVSKDLVGTRDRCTLEISLAALASACPTKDIDDASSDADAELRPSSL